MMMMSEEVEDCNESSSTKSMPLPSWKEMDGEIIAEIARNELGETPEKVQYGLTFIREYIKRNKLKFYENDDYLLKFLRVKKFRLEDSCKHVKSFVRSMKNAYDKYGPIDPVMAKRVFKKGNCAFLPCRDQQGRYILIYRMGNSEDVNWLEAMRTAMFGLLHVANDPSSQTCGVNVIIDGLNTCVQELAYVNTYGLALLKLLDGVPYRLSRIDVVNSSKLFRLCYIVVRPFLPRKLSERLVLHSGCADALRKHYDMSLIPDEFGGSGGPLSNAHWEAQMDSSIEMIARMQLRIITGHH